MATVVPLDEFTGEWYPGYEPEHFEAPYIVDRASPFRPGDEERFWYLDFHWSRGLTPLAATLWAADGYCWGTQHAAENLPLPSGRGVSVRYAGTHLYASGIPESDPREAGARAARLGVTLPRFLQNFTAVWESGRDELEATWRYFEGIDVGHAPLPRFPALMIQARRYLKRAAEIHFGVMYPMLVNFLAFRGTCAELGIDTSRIGTFLQGEDTKIMETDRELHALAATARKAGLREAFAGAERGGLRAALSGHGGRAGQWLTDFDDFLQAYGHRQEAPGDVGAPSWLEDPEIPLSLVKTFLREDRDHDFAAAAREAVAEREAAVDAARAGLTREEQAVFDGGLAANRAANFPWWQDDHNFYIDLKVMLPLRRMCHELARRVGADHPDDLIHLFWPELLEVASGRPYDGRLRSLVRDRRQYFDDSKAKRAAMPKVLGTIPETVEDPILIEIFGFNPDSIRAMRDPDAGRRTVLSGVAAARGTATGTARVLQSSDELHRLFPGDVLVCESTSPNWTPVFGSIAAAVCDGGGMLSHAAIVGREYGVPTVTAVGVATHAIGDGDQVEVDGTRGTVTILERAR
jgi:phosphoenolpyruvate synthase/pyruvate phosphate dikinase